MRKIVCGLAIVFLTITGFSQRNQTDLQFEGLKGKVKSVQGSSIFFGTKDKPIKSPKREYHHIEFYDLNGNIIEELHSERGIKYVYEFVDGFLSMKKVVVDKLKPGGLSSKAIGNAEDMEKPVKSIKPDERFVTRFDDEYDDKGRRRLRRIFFSDGQMDSITRYSYNFAGLLEKEVYNTYGNKWSYFYSYDTNGNWKEKSMERSDVKGVVDMTDRTEYGDYKFDAEGNWIERRYTYHHDYDGSSTTSEGIDYREIEYHGSDRTKRKAIRRQKK